jgi:hypothetical protein
MRRQLSALALVAGTTLTPVITAQSRPDFSGTWTLDEANSDSATHQGFVGPVTWVIGQSPRQLVVEIRRGQKTMTLTFAIYDKPPGTAAAGVPSYIGYWKDDALVTETAQNIQGQTVTTREIRTLQADGQHMVVERTVQVEHGYTLRRGQNYSTAKDLFIKGAP